MIKRNEFMADLAANLYVKHDETPAFQCILHAAELAEELEKKGVAPWQDKKPSDSDEFLYVARAKKGSLNGFTHQPMENK